MRQTHRFLPLPRPGKGPYKAMGPSAPPTLPDMTDAARRDPDPDRPVSGCRRGGGAAGQAAAHRHRARLSAGRRADRAVRPRLRLHRVRGRFRPALRRVRHRAAAVPDRTGTAAEASVDPARQPVRRRRRPGGDHRPGPCRHRHLFRPGLADGPLCGPGAVAVVDGVCPAGAGGERGTRPAPRPHGLRGAAVPGPGGDPAARPAAAVRGRRRRHRPAHDGFLGPAGDRHHPGRRGGRPVPARPGLQSDRPHAREGGDDGQRAADRGRRDAGDELGRPLGGTRRLHRRRAAGRLRVPARDQCRHRALRGPAAGAVLHGHRHGAQSRPDRPEADAGAGGGGRLARDQDRGAVRARPPRRPGAGSLAALCAGDRPGRRVRLRAVHRRRIGHRAGAAARRAAHGRRHAVDGGDAAAAAAGRDAARPRRSRCAPSTRCRRATAMW